MARTPESGRRPGSRNKTTREFRHAVKLAFERIGGVQALSEWAGSNPGEFYRIAARLIPGEMAASAPAQVLRVVVDSGYTHAGRSLPQTFQNAAPALLSDGGEGE